MVLSPPRFVFGEGAFSRLGEAARDLGFRRSLLVSDPGLVAAGFVGRALDLLAEAGVSAIGFHEFGSNPDSRMVERGREVAAAAGVDSLIGLGGGSSLDCAKGVNFLLTSGGRIHDYKGYGKARAPMLPMIGVPTTAGAGSEAQSYALISDAATHVKMACGDPGAAFRVAILDPCLTVSQPRAVTAATGLDAIAHAVEVFVTRTRTIFSDALAREAWLLLEPAFARVLEAPGDLPARGAMLAGACAAGLAIEQSMLGATHACANPLTARYGIIHGEAIARLLPWVVRWNAATCRDRYVELAWLARLGGEDGPERVAARLEELARLAGFGGGLSRAGVSRDDLPSLAADAEQQWTGTFNPRPFDRHGALEIYTWAF
jgi:alcohol dehydrogenase